MTRGARDYSVTASVTYRGETRDFGVFDTWEGGNVTSDNTKHRRGALGIQISIGGPKSIDDITITRDYDLARDHQHAHWLSGCVGRARGVFRKQPLDDNSVAYGAPLVLQGVIIGYNHPSHDSDSSDVSMVALVLSPNDTVG